MTTRASLPVAASDTRRCGGMLFAIGVFKLVKCALLLALGSYALARGGEGFAHGTLHVASFLRLDPGNHVVHALLAKITGVPPRTFHRLAIGTFVYAALFAVEGIGLLLGKRWGEIVTIVITGSFVPLEVYETVHHATIVRVLATLVNAAIVVYLVVRVRRENHAAG